MIPAVTIRPAPGSSALAVEVLTPKQLRQAQYQATLRTVNKIAVVTKREVQKRANIAPKYLKSGEAGDSRNRAIFVAKPKGDPPSGAVEIVQKGLPLAAFPSVATKTFGVRAVAQPGRGAMKFRHGFRATMPSGHKGYFVRQKLGVATAAEMQRHVINGGTYIDELKAADYAKRFGIIRSGRLRALMPITPRGIARRLPIVELRGPSVLTVASLKDAVAAVEFDASAEYERQMDNQIRRFWGGARGPELWLSQSQN